MPRFYCEYCDVYLKCASQGCRREHNFGKRHITNKIDYYTHLIREKSLAPPIHTPPMWLVQRIKKRMTESYDRAPQMGMPPPVIPAGSSAVPRVLSSFADYGAAGGANHQPVSSEETKGIASKEHAAGQGDAIPNPNPNMNAMINNAVMPQVLGTLPPNTGMGMGGMGTPGMGAPGMGTPGMGTPGMGTPGMGMPGMGMPGMGMPGKGGMAGMGMQGGHGPGGMVGIQAPVAKNPGMAPMRPGMMPNMMGMAQMSRMPGQ